MGDAPDFITGFHNLEGDLIGERKKNFYKLLKRPGLFSNEQELNDVLQKLVPKTYQESLFYLDLLIYFKRTNLLVEILKSGNPLFATKILKQKWFLEQFFKNTEAEVLIKDFMCFLSYIVRKKLLNGISKCWEEKKIDELFDALEKCYGISIALEILHKCSLDKIKSIFEDNEIKLRPNQVIQLYNKSHEVLKCYLDHFKKINNEKYSEKKVVNYIALKEPQFILELEKEEKLTIISLGRRTSKNLIKCSGNDISNDIKRYTIFLNKPVLVRKLSPNFKTVYKKLCPDKFSEFNWYSWNLVQHYPKNRRWDLFFDTFRDKFPNKTILDIFTKLDSTIKFIQPPQEIIHHWAKICYEKQDGDSESYLKYYPTPKAIEILKGKIDVTSDKNKRVDLVMLMLDNCEENKDLSSLEDIMKYISIRHKNEETYFRHRLLTKIKDAFKLTELNGSHWKYIFEQLQILKIQKDSSFYWLSEIYHRYLEFLFKNKKDHSVVLDSYISDIIDDHLYQSLDLKNPPIEKMIYSEICEKFPKFIKKDSENYVHNICNLMSKIISFSMDNKDHCIKMNNYPHFVDQITETFNSSKKVEYAEKEVLTNIIIYNDTFPENSINVEQSKVLDRLILISKEDEKSCWWMTHVLNKFVKTKNRSNFGNELLKCYLEQCLEIAERDVVPWLLKNEPKKLEPYFETILKVHIDTDCFPLDATMLSIYSHFDFDRKAREYFKQQLELIDKKKYDSVNRLLRNLSVLLPVQEFIKIVEGGFLPKKDKLDLEDEEMRDLYQIQSELAKALAKVPEPYKMLPTIMKFAKGDFFHLCLQALYGAFYNSPQRILYSYIEHLGKQAVSARKHAIFLSCAVLDKDHTIQLLRTTNYSNVSSQKHLFSATLKYFLKNPSEDLLQLVTENMNTIDKHDAETLDSLGNIRVPTKYRHTYIEKCWSFFENFEPDGVIITSYLEKLLDYMCGDILISLSKDFVVYIFNKYFTAEGTQRLGRINHFAVKVLKDRKSERDHNFNLIFQILSKLKNSTINDFFNSFLQIAREKSVEKEFVLSFSSYWYKHFTAIQTLQEYIALKLLILKLNNPDLEKYAQNVVNYMDQLISELSFLVTSVFKEQLIDALCTLELKEKLNFYLSMLNHKLDSNTAVLVIQILDNIDEDEEEDVKKVYENIRGILESVEIPIVKAYCKSYLGERN